MSDILRVVLAFTIMVTLLRLAAMIGMIGPNVSTIVNASVGFTAGVFATAAAFLIFSSLESDHR